ncbi:uncharacterized protein LOC128193025 [Crassostrea angulata]|uniref:uncharacterized protein LOC128193025 n=1 Tax=Magallana angulata TaxID=2784310 RepID=UPI0022B1BE88|nr:uncharacterized protein LOC128193025 [Crassostrea angulata]
MRPKLEPNYSNLGKANGDLVVPEGQTVLQFKIKGEIIEHRAIVADIDAQMILGFDFLSEHNCQLHLGEGTLTLGDQRLVCDTVSDQSSVFKISVQETLSIPPRSEMIIEGKVHQNLNYKKLLIDGTKRDLQQSGLLVARCLVKPKECKVPIRVINVSDHELKIYKDTSAATCIAEIEPNVSEVQTKNDTNMEPDVDASFTNYMKPLWDSCTKNLSKEQEELVRDLLQKHIKVFAKSKTDLGKTNIVSHKINTGDAKPIKQQPRRIPLHKKEAAKEELQRMLKEGN